MNVPTDAISREPPVDALVIGYGNELRRDDGIGPYIAREIGARHIPGVRTLAVHQLTPELAADLSTVRVAVFVDAHRDEQTGCVEIQRIKPLAARSSMSHVYQPSALLEFAKVVFGRMPEAWSAIVAGEDFGAGDGLSRMGRRNADAAVEQIDRLLRTACGCQACNSLPSRVRRG